MISTNMTTKNETKKRATVSSSAESAQRKGLSVSLIDLPSGSSARDELQKRANRGGE